MTKHLRDEQVLFENISINNALSVGGKSVSAVTFGDYAIGTATTVSLTRTLEMGSPTAANCAAVIATLIHDLLGKK